VKKELKLTGAGFSCFLRKYFEKEAFTMGLVSVLGWIQEKISSILAGRILTYAVFIFLVMERLNIVKRAHLKATKKYILGELALQIVLILRVTYH
jgi:hypothetical protein